MNETDRPFHWLGCAAEAMDQPAEPPPWMSVTTAAVDRADDE